MSVLDKAKIYAELAKIKIELNHADTPSPAYIQDKTFECNEANRKVEKHYLSVNQELSNKRRLYKVEKFSFESKKRQALTNNEKIKKLPTGKEREAAVEELYEQELRQILDLENDLNDLKDLMDAIKMVQANLKTTASDIRVQLRVMEQQINRLNVGTRDDPEVSSFNKTLSDLDDLEKEITIDDVESSAELEADESGDQSVIVETNTTVSDEGSQDEAEEGKEEESGIESFLVDDSNDIEIDDSTDTTEKVSEPETSNEVSVEVAGDISIPEDVVTEPAETTVKGTAPEGGLDLSDIDLSSIEIDISDSSTSTTEKKQSTETPIETKAPTKTELAEPNKETQPQAKIEKPFKSADQPKSAQKSESKEKISDDFLEDILTMLD